MGPRGAGGNEHVTRPRRRLPLSILAVFAVLAVSVGAATVAPLQAQEAEDTVPAESVETEKVRVRTAESPIGDSELASLAENNTVAPASARLGIEVYGPNLDAVRAAIESVGGEPYGEVPGFFVEARVPIGAFATLNNNEAVTRIEQVTQVAQAASNSFANNPELASILDDSQLLGQWHSLAHEGQGQRIGILDLFGAAELSTAISSDRIPNPSGTFCRNNGRSCNISVPGGGGHGVAVAEIIHNAAPRAELYLATVVTTADLAAAIEWFGSEGVTVINRSETSEFDGPGNGTGPTASLVDRAIALDMVWVAAAGNAGGGDGRDGQNWVGNFNDPDGNGLHNFADGSERMAFTCGFLLGMRWDDWADGTIPTDYDIYIYDSLTATVPEAVGDDLQSLASHVPLEHVTTRCQSSGDIDYISIRRYEDVRSDGTDEIQILGNQTVMTEWTNRHSALGPGNDSANPGAVIVGASVSPVIGRVAPFSSQGPTFDGRPAIDVVAPSCLPIPDFFDACFAGTSASAPVVAGTVAVLRGAGVISSAQQADRVAGQISIDGGTPGIDNAYGNGLLTLPNPGALGAWDRVPQCNGTLATIIGSEGDDVLVGTPGNDVFFAAGGNDILNGRGGDDILCAGHGDDFIDSGEGNNSIFAGPGNDTITASYIRDFVDPQTGNNIIQGQGARGDTAPSIGSALWPRSIETGQ